MSSGQEKVLVTGATGFIGSHVVKLLLGDGFRLRLAARNVTDDNPKVKQLKAAFAEHADKIELVEADLLDSSVNWPGLVSECQFVVHVASSFPERVPKNQAEADIIMRTAIEGTRAVMTAVAGEQSVKKLIVTSSVASVAGIMGTKGTVYDESVWFSTDNRPNTLTYEKSKTLAEKEAWRIFGEIKDPHFSLVCINPGVVIGPLLLPQAYSTSLNLIRFILNREASMLPQVCVPIIDVRDVARAHLSALTSSAADGKRVIVTAGTLELQKIAMAMDEHLGPLGYRVPLRCAPNILVRVLGFFRSDIAQLLFGLNCETVYDNSRMKNLLRVEPMDITQSIVDTACSLIDHGYVAKTLEYSNQKGSQQG